MLGLLLLFSFHLHWVSQYFRGYFSTAWRQSASQPVAFTVETGVSSSAAADN